MLANWPGREIFRKVREYARSISSGSIRFELNVNCNNPTVCFYEHPGMTKSRQEDFPIGKGFYMNDIIMSIDL